MCELVCTLVLTHDDGVGIQSLLGHVSLEVIQHHVSDVHRSTSDGGGEHFFNNLFLHFQFQFVRRGHQHQQEKTLIETLRPPGGQLMDSLVVLQVFFLCVCQRSCVLPI